MSEIRVPVAPYTRAIPYRRNPDAKAPSKEVLEGRLRRRARRRSRPAEHVDRDRHQLQSRKITIKSAPAAMTIMPSVPR